MIKPSFRTSAESKPYSYVESIETFSQQMAGGCKADMMKYFHTDSWDEESRRPLCVDAYFSM